MTDEQPEKVEVVRKYEVYYDGWDNPYRVQHKGIEIRNPDGDNDSIPEKVKRFIFGDILS